MKIDATTKASKSYRGQILSYTAYYRDLGTARQHLTRETASTDLIGMIQFRCEHESARVEVLTLRSHVGIFSYGLHGDVATRHLWPGDGHVSLSTGDKTIEEAKASFRYHVAQITWTDWDLEQETSAILEDNQQEQFTSWARFQKM
jgi:hypothetical protein